MTLPAMIRVFFAIDLPLEIKKRVAETISILKKKTKSHAIRWSIAENLHITLQFLPILKSTDLALLQEKAHHAIKQQRSLAFELHRLMLFPNPYRPRVIVWDVSPQAALAECAKHLGVGIKEAGYAVENRAFRAHLTLGRIKHVRDINLQFLHEMHLPRIDNLKLTEIVLFRSEPKIDRSIYTVLDRIRLLE